MRFEEIVIETDRLAFPALAAGDGPVVVCWHGFPDHPATFGPLAERLVAAGRRVVAPFLRGHHPATADRLPHGDGLTLAADAEAVARALSPDAGVDMIGHDIGAGMVGRVAAVWPERVRRAVTMAVPPPATLPAALRDPAQQRRFFYLWLFQVPDIAEAVLEADRGLVDFLWDTWSPGLDPGEHRDRVHALYGDPALLRNALRIYRANFDRGLHDPALAHHATRSEAPASIPLLVLAGADDGCIPPEFFTGAEAGLATGSAVRVIPGAGHFMQLDRPDEVARQVLDWFGS
ncbi:alpha/beta fold hydrolase [Amycolatopsis suaedae]|uniref:Alpha/beta hydrolase n=1 Tax=Amycolatopsis suaedae TaxID=2510978 RepID=A0A4Q7J7W8_9PSEU|nr:alpha/beta fold hydrolase [Amycolatopsis suaedae]RZQ63038.1 alpha/beta hydrolase [Amycolatopsis suaedae]